MFKKGRLFFLSSFDFAIPVTMTLSFCCEHYGPLWWNMSFPSLLQFVCTLVHCSWPSKWTWMAWMSLNVQDGLDKYWGLQVFHFCLHNLLSMTAMIIISLAFCVNAFVKRRKINFISSAQLTQLVYTHTVHTDRRLRTDPNSLFAVDAS